MRGVVRILPTNGGLEIGFLPRNPISCPFGMGRGLFTLSRPRFRPLGSPGPRVKATVRIGTWSAIVRGVVEMVGRWQVGCCELRAVMTASRLWLRQESCRQAVNAFGQPLQVESG
jgi:hypothetical protein